MFVAVNASDFIHVYIVSWNWLLGVDQSRTIVFSRRVHHRGCFEIGCFCKSNHARRKTGTHFCELDVPCYDHYPGGLRYEKGCPRRTIIICIVSSLSAVAVVPEGLSSVEWPGDVLRAGSDPHLKTRAAEPCTWSWINGSSILFPVRSSTNSAPTFTHSEVRLIWQSMWPCKSMKIFVGFCNSSNSKPTYFQRYFTSSIHLRLHT